MPVWKASREGIRERERGKKRGRGEEQEEEGGREGRHCVVWDRRGFVCWGWLHHPSVFLWIWSQQHILFCHYLGSWYSSTECCKLAPERRHIFSASLWQNNSWRIVWTGEFWNMSDPVWETQKPEVFTAVQCHTFTMFSSVCYRWSAIRKCKTPLDRSESILLAESEWEIKAPNLNWALKLNVVAAAVRGFVILVLRFATRTPF